MFEAVRAPGAFIFQVRPPTRPGAPSRVRTDVSRVKAKSATNLHHRGSVFPVQGWCPRRELNSGPPASEAGALSTELRGPKFVSRDDTI